MLIKLNQVKSKPMTNLLSVTNILQISPTRWQQRPAVVDMEKNYIVSELNNTPRNIKNYSLSAVLMATDLIPQNH